MGKGKKAKLRKISSKPIRPPTKPVSGATLKKDRKKPGKGQSQHRPIIPFDLNHRILLVGEGDFSFAHCLSTEYKCNSITATTIEAREPLLAKYPQAATHIAALASTPSASTASPSDSASNSPPDPPSDAPLTSPSNHHILYNIDATKLGLPHTPSGAFLRTHTYDRIAFLFPHTGGLTRDVNRQVRANQSLLVAFFACAQKLLTPTTGRIVVTLFEGEPYTLWNVRDLARHAGLGVERSERWDWRLWKGYGHVRTFGMVEGGGGWKGDERDARMFVLLKKGDEVKVGVKRKRTEDSDEESGKD